MENEIEINQRLDKVKEILESNESKADKIKQIARLFMNDKKSPGRKNLGADIIEEMKKLRDEGHSYEEIGKATGVVLSSVRYHLSPKDKERVKSFNVKTQERRKIDPEMKKKYNEYQRIKQHEYRQRQKEIIAKYKAEAEQVAKKEEDITEQ